MSNWHKKYFSYKVMPISKKILILLVAIASQFILFYFLSLLTIFPEKNNSQNRLQLTKSPYLGRYIINVHSIEIEESSSGSVLENVIRAENTIPMPVEEPFKQRIDARLAKLKENIGNPEKIPIEKAVYVPKEKSQRKDGDKRKIAKLTNHKQFNYAGLVPEKKNITEHNSLMKLRKLFGLDSNEDNKGISHKASSEKNDYLKVIISKIHSEKYYPRIAKKRGIQGDALLRFELKTDGGLEKVNILKSSGSNILDKAAVNTVKKAAPFPYINGSIDVVLSYQFNE
jgi:TonB family protein